MGAGRGSGLTNRTLATKLGEETHQTDHSGNARAPIRMDRPTILWPVQAARTFQRWVTPAVPPAATRRITTCSPAGCQFHYQDVGTWQTSPYFTDGESPAHTAINARLAELEAAILGHNLPVGTIVLFAGSAAPSGWLLCDGSAVSRLTYAALFAIAGVLFGVGNGSTTFNVPGFRGRTAIGAGTGSGLTLRNFAGQVGAETHRTGHR